MRMVRGALKALKADQTVPNPGSHAMFGHSSTAYTALSTCLGPVVDRTCSRHPLASGRLSQPCSSCGVCPKNSFSNLVRPLALRRTCSAMSPYQQARQPS